MKLKIDAVKLKIHHFINDTIDLYIPPISFIDKMKNSTAKLWVSQNIWKLNKALEAFGDQNQEIDVDKVIDLYSDTLFEEDELKLDVKSMIPPQYDWLNAYLPNKIILFKKEDLKFLTN